MNTKQTLEQFLTLHIQPTELRPSLSTTGLLATSMKTEKTSKDSRFKQHNIPGIHVIKATNINSKIKTTQITANSLSEERSKKQNHDFISIVVDLHRRYAFLCLFP